MKNSHITKLSLLCASSLFLIGCDQDFSNPVGDTSSYSNGNADFSNYVSVGDSLTAGYADGALYLNGQKNSYPNILATQFKTVGGSTFTQPLMNDNLGGLLFGGVANPTFSNRLVLNADPALSSPKPEAIAGTPTNEIVIGAPVLNGTFNNMGVPGAKSFHLGAPGYGSAGGLGAGTANPYFVRFASTTTTTVIADAASQVPTFFTLWIGNNDVLSFATGGGVGANQLGNTNPATYGSSDITDPTLFAATYTGLVGALTTGANVNAKGVLVSIPDVSTIPYFTTVPHNPVPLDQTNADALNTAYQTYNTTLQALVGTALTQAEATQRTITFSAGLTNSVVILDEGLTDLTGVNPALINMRQATSNDLIVLPTSSIIGTLADPNDPTSVRGLGVPLGDKDVLIPSEIAAINTARLAFNNTIKATADAKPNLAFYDASAFMARLKANGINFGTGSVNSNYASGGAFSLDGVHPTARGYSLVANGIIDTINTAFGANIPKVDPGTYTTIFLK